MEKDNIDKEELELKIKENFKKQNKQLRNILLLTFLFLAIFLGSYFYFQSIKSFEYEGVEFEIEEYCDSKPCLIFYKTSIPLSYQDSVTGNIINADYNIYLRNNPKDLEKISVNGKINFRKNMVVGVNTENLFCEGDWSLAIGNLQKLNILGVNLIAKNNSEIKIYFPTEEYMYINIKESNETSIEEINEYNYNLNIDNCEILMVTERLMLEAFVQANN